MADPEKIRLMTRLAMLEKHEGRDVERVRSCFHSDYIGIPMFKNGLRITTVFLLLLLIWGAGRTEFLLNVVAEGKLVLLLVGIGAAYAMLLLITLIVTFLMSSAAYYRNRDKADEYEQLLEELQKLSQGDRTEDVKRERFEEQQDRQKEQREKWISL